jgi:hypothetical protein
VVVDDHANSVNAVGAGDGEAPQNPGTGLPQGPGPSAPPTSPARGADINAQLAQVRELEAKLAEEYCEVRLLLTQNVHLAPSTQQAEQAGFTRAKNHKTCQSIFPEN